MTTYIPATRLAQMPFDDFAAVYVIGNHFVDSLCNAAIARPAYAASDQSQLSMALSSILRSSANVLGNTGGFASGYCGSSSDPASDIAYAAVEDGEVSADLPSQSMNQPFQMLNPRCQRQNVRLRILNAEQHLRLTALNHSPPAPSCASVR